MVLVYLVSVLHEVTHEKHQHPREIAGEDRSGDTHWACNKAASAAQTAEKAVGCVVGACSQRRVTFPYERVNGVSISEEKKLFFGIFYLH
jgi:hypothetical protein